MGQSATKYGVLADMEELQRLLGNTLKQYTQMRDVLQEVRANNDVRAEKNARLRNRLDKMKGSVSAQMNDLFAKMMNVRPEDVMSEEEIVGHLTDAFNKFESSGDGRLGLWVTFISIFNNQSYMSKPHVSQKNKFKRMF